jgi:CelD/BcsL family acetyltransferase involved in cellulose biosynthesis
MLKFIPADEFASDAFAAKWRALLEQCPPHDVGQTDWWNRCWWKHYAAGKHLFIIAEEKDGQLLALWPLCRRKRFGLRVLSWVGQADGMITDYTMPLLPERHREKGVQAVFEFLAEHQAQWDIVDLSLPGWSGLLPVMTRSAAVYGVRNKLSWHTHIIEHCTAIDLPASFDTFLASLGSTTRSHVRQYLRAVDKLGAEFEILRGPACSGALPELISLNRERWQVFDDERARVFLADYVAQLPPEDEATFLLRLRLGDRTLAAILGFEASGVCYLHSAGVTREAPTGLSPGTVMYALFAKAMIEGGRTRLDMSPGMEEYKLRLGAVVDAVYGLTLWRGDAAIDRWRLGHALIGAKRWLFAAKRRLLAALKRD